MNAVKSIVLGLVCLAGAAQGAELPVKYLEYVEATGSQYVDTGFVPNGNTKIEATYQLVELGQARNYVFGVYGASNTGRCQFSPAALTFAGFGNSYNDKISIEADTNWHTVVMDKGTFKVDGNQIYKVSFNGTSKNLYLFAVNGNGTAASFATNRISLVKIYDNGALKRLMVPCQMANGKVGFWDFATGQFYGNAVTDGADFVAGGEVPSPLERLEYVRFANGTFVDTGVKPTDHETAIRFRDEKSAAGGYLFGGANNNQWLYSLWSDGAKWTWGYSGTSTRSFGGYTPNVDHTVVYNDVNGGRVYMDGQDMGKAIDATPSSNLYLGRRYNTYNYEGRVYWVKVTDRSTGDLAVWLEPMRVCGTVGFYDPAVGKLRFQGAGTLSAGPLQAGQFEIAGQRGFAVEGMTPACGLYEDLSVGDEVEVSAPATTVLAPELTVTCAGWKLYEWNDEVMGWEYNEGRENASGTGTSFTYVHTGVATKLEWQWSFANPSAAGNERYAAEFGNDDADGESWVTAKKTVQAAIDAAPDYGKVLVAPGYYYATHSTIASDSSTYAVYLERPVSVIGVAGPENTTVDAGIDMSRAGARITNADALLAGISLVNCYYSAKNKPTGVEGNAGVFSNCWIKVRGEWAHSGWIMNVSGSLKAYDIVMQPYTVDVSEGGYAVYMKDNATLDGFTARNVVITGNGTKQLLYLDGNAKASNVLIANCRFGKVEVASLAPFVTVNGAGAVLSDATVVNNNIMANNGAVQVSNSKAIVTNSIIWANTSSSLANPNIQSASNLAQFFNSCCNEFATDNAQGNIIVDPQFVDAANGDYHLRSLSKAKEMGVVALRPSGATTLECAGDADTYVSASGESLAVTLTGYCAGEQGEVLATWDFGDGTTSTDWPTATHVYETPGAYTVTLTVSDGVGAPAVYTFSKPLVCTPETCYMSTTGTDTYPYDTWEKATPSLQAALDVGSAKIVVTNGNYEIPAPVIGISRAVTLTSVEGPEKTTFTSLGTTTCDHRNLTLGGSDAILVSGFTFNDGYAANYEWTASIQMSSGTLTNCVFKNIRRVSRSAACYFYGTAKVFDCVFDGHGMGWSNDSSIQSGVRIEGSAVLDRCEIFAFKIENNSDGTNFDGESPVRIAAATAVLRNSYVHHCTNGVPTSANVKNRGPVGLVNGRIENCTIVNNVCAGYGGGVWAIGGTVVNSIIWDNKAGMAGNDVYVRGSATPKFLYSCASDFEAGAAITGEGCTAKSPNFDADKPYHLTPLSTACLNTGTTNLTWMTAGALDKDRLPRVVVNGEVAEDGVDMGCYEYQESTVVPLDGTIDVVGSASGRAPFAATLEASIVGDEEGLKLVWDFGDGKSVEGGKRETHTYESPGSYTVTVHASNGAAEEKDIAATTPVVVVPQVCYVSKEGKGIAPYMTWENAATNLHDAVELNPKTVFVSNGLYKISREISIQSDLEFRSVNGPEVTIIDAQNLCRNLWMTDQAEGAVVDGFSLWRGTGNWDTKSNYARVEAGLLSHCILSNCATGVYRDSAVLVKTKGRMVDCVVDNAGMGGNADCTHFFGTVVQSGGIIERCTIQRYNYTNQGGAGNTHGAVHVEGTGIFRNCLVKDCVSTQSTSGDAKRGAVLVSGNGVVENCTIVNSKSCQSGAGLTILSGTPTVRNCIVWGAKLGDGTATTAVRDLGSPATPRITYSCAPELTTGEGNTTADPQFRTKRGVPYQFGSKSPCYDTAQRLDWMGEDAIDILGNPRIFSVAPDMGCFESESAGLMMFVK